MVNCRKIIVSISVLFICFLPVVSGCSGEKLTFTQVMSKSGAAMEQVTSYRIKLTGNHTENGETTNLNGNIDFVAPDKMHTVQTLPGENESIVIDGYIYAPAGNDLWTARKWPGDTTAMATSFIGQLNTLAGVTQLDDESIDGELCFHYEGYFDLVAQAEEEKAKLDTTDPTYEIQVKMIENLKNMKHKAELWIGEKDYYLHKVVQYQEITVPDEDTPTVQTIYSVFRFYDFNGNIIVEAPPPELVQGVFLTHSATSSIGGKDITKQQISYEIHISNQGQDTVNNLRVYIDTPATNLGPETIEALPENSPVNLVSGESATYKVTWEYDMSQTSKEELADLMKKNSIRAEWTDENFTKQEETLSSN